MSEETQQPAPDEKKPLSVDEMLSLESLFDYALRNNQEIYCKPLAGCATHIITIDKPERKYKEPTYGVGFPQSGQGVNDHIYQEMAFWTANQNGYWSLYKPK